MKTILHYYRYRWFFRSFNTLFNFAGLFFPIIILLPILVDHIINHELFTFPNIIATIATTLVLWLFAGPIFIITGNYFLEIVSDSEGLHVKFTWGKLDIPWTDVTSLKPTFSITTNKRQFVIKAKTKPTSIIHSLYGFYYTFCFSPCIIFSKDISDGDKLIGRVTLAISRNQNKLLSSHQ